MTYTVNIDFVEEFAGDWTGYQIQVWCGLLPSHPPRFIPEGMPPSKMGSQSQIVTRWVPPIRRPRPRVKP